MLSLIDTEPRSHKTKRKCLQQSTKYSFLQNIKSSHNSIIKRLNTLFTWVKNVNVKFHRRHVNVFQWKGAQSHPQLEKYKLK